MKNYEDVNISQIKNWSSYYKKIEQNTVLDFSFVKTWFNLEKYIYHMYYPCCKIHKPWLEKEDIFCIIERNIELYHKNKLTPRVPFFDYIQQKVTSGSHIHFGLMQHLILLYPDAVKAPKQKKCKSIYEYQNEFQNILHPKVRLLIYFHIFLIITENNGNICL